MGELPLSFGPSTRTLSLYGASDLSVGLEVGSPAVVGQKAPL